MDSLMGRLESLERSNRRLMWALGISIALAIAGSATARPKDRILDAEAIIVRDSRPRVTIGTPRVVGAGVSMNSDDPAIWISDRSGNDRLILTADGVRVADEKGRPSLDLGAGTGGATIRLYDAGNRLVWSAPAP
jgi:hypothetical protein